MAEITRPGNVQAFASSATPGERTVFGDTVQSDALDDNLNSDFFAGWENGVDASGFPPRQFFNAVGYTATQLIAYLYQRGIAQWDAAQEYYHPAFVVGSDNRLYESLQDNTGVDPTTDGGTNWVDYADSIAVTVPDASETERGIIELATQAETDAGTDDLRAITPAKLANYAGFTSSEYAIFSDVKPASADGGSFSSGAWRTRVLNTVVLNNIAGASLSSNVITLPAGTYSVRWSAPAFVVNAHQSRLYNSTDAVTLAEGTTEYSGVNANTRSLGDSTFTLDVAKDVVLQHRSDSSQNGDGYGRSSDFGPSTFSIVIVEKTG